MKLFNFLAAFLLVFSPFFSFEAHATSVSDIEISKISLESIEIKNTGEELEFENFIITDENQEIARAEKGIFTQNSHILVSKNSGDIQLLEDNFGEILTLKIDDKNIDSICFKTKTECENLGISKVAQKPQIGEIWVFDESLNDFILQNDVTFLFGGLAEKPQIQPKNSCGSFKISEVLNNSSEQFIEIENTSNEEKNLKNCKIETLAGASRTKKVYIFSDENISANGFFVLKLGENNNLNLTKTTENEVVFLSEEDSEIDNFKIEKGSKKEMSWIRNDSKIMQTFENTPGFENIFRKCQIGLEEDENGDCVEPEIEEYEKKCEAGYFLNEATNRCNKIQQVIKKECSDGYFLNLATNRCNKVQEEKVLAECAAGYFRNPETGRCKKFSSEVSNLMPCKDGYERNAETNRCRKIESETEGLTPCKEGYERNTETNRCRKIVKNNSAGNGVESEVSKESEFAGWWAIFVVAGVILVVIFWEFRKEIFAKFKKGKK